LYALLERGNGASWSLGVSNRVRGEKKGGGEGVERERERGWRGEI
jgi:hypothetical protein